MQYNEADISNESCICFRHREIKAVRAQHAAPSDKVLRLRAEVSSGLEIAEVILRREHIKCKLLQQIQAVWAKRLPVLELKRQHPGLDSMEDEELLLEK